MTQKVLSYDLGGTKLAAAVVTENGKVLHPEQIPVAIQKGKQAVIAQMVSLGKKLIRKYPDITRIGVACAGPMDPMQGTLLNPTNLVTHGKRWGTVPLAKILEKQLKLPVTLENDAAAALLAEHWVGVLKRSKNAIILTLGTGLGTGILCNGKLVRSGKNLHTEAGHLIIQAFDTSAPCGCGNFGCAEAYLSGINFARRLAERFGQPDLTAKDLAEMARRGEQRALAAFRDYSNLMAVTLMSLIRVFNPDVFVFTGSFAEASDLFLPGTRKELRKLLSASGQAIPMPALKISSLHNHAGVIGAAFQSLAAHK